MDVTFTVKPLTQPRKPKRAFNLLDYTSWPGAFWLRATGQVCFVEPANGVNFTLGEVYGYTNGGLIQLFVLGGYFCSTDTGYDMYLNEDGRSKNLPGNACATRLWVPRGSSVHARHPVLGDVLVCRKELCR